MTTDFYSAISLLVLLILLIFIVFCNLLVNVDTESIDWVGQVKKLFENDKCKTLQKSTLARKRNDGGNALDADKVEMIIGK